MIDYNGLWYEAWNKSNIKIHFSSFNAMAKKIKKLKQSFDNWTVVIHYSINGYKFHSLPHKISSLNYYDAEEGYRNIGEPILLMFPENFPIEDYKTEFEFECDFVIGDA